MRDKNKLKKSLNLSDEDFEDAEDFENDVLGKPPKKSSSKKEPEIVWCDKNGNIIEDDEDEPDWMKQTDDEAYLDFAPPVEPLTRRQLDLWEDEGDIRRGVDEHFGYAVVDPDDTTCMGVALGEDIHPGKYDVFVTRDAFGRPASIKIVIPND